MTSVVGRDAAEAPAPGPGGDAAWRAWAAEAQAAEAMGDPGPPPSPPCETHDTARVHSVGVARASEALARVATDGKAGAGCPRLQELAAGVCLTPGYTQRPVFGDDEAAKWAWLTDLLAVRWVALDEAMRHPYCAHPARAEAFLVRHCYCSCYKMRVAVN